MEPILTAIEAMTEQGCYTARFLVGNGAEHSVVMRVRDGKVGAPEANMIAGWSADSPSFRAVVAAVGAVDEARRVVGSQRPQLLDVDGGWDVGLGNVVLSSSAVPTCVGHGEMQPGSDQRWDCAECGAAALLSSPA